MRVIRTFNPDLHKNKKVNTIIYKLLFIIYYLLTILYQKYY